MKLVSAALGLTALMCLSGAAFAVNPAVPPAKPIAPKPVAPKPTALPPTLSQQQKLDPVIMQSATRQKITPTDDASKRKAVAQQTVRLQQKRNEAFQVMQESIKKMEESRKSIVGNTR